MFILPSLPFGSASRGKTQPLLHPAPPDHDERGGLMHSSWTALLRASLRPDHQRTGTASAASSPRCVRGLPGTGQAGGGRFCPRSSALIPFPLLQPLEAPQALQLPAVPAVRGDGGVPLPPVLAFAMAEPPHGRAVCLLQGCLCPLPAGKSLGRDRGKHRSPGCSR